MAKSEGVGIISKPIDTGHLAKAVPVGDPGDNVAESRGEVLRRLWIVRDPYS